MPEFHLSLMLAVSRVGVVLGLLLVTSVLFYLTVKGIRTGKIGTRSTLRTEEENFVSFWLGIIAYFILAVMMFLMLLGAVFAPFLGAVFAP